MRNVIDEKEFRDWLDANRRLLVDRDPHDISHVAITCGFDFDLVCRIIPTWSIDAICRNTEQMRSDWVVGREIKFIELNGSLNLKEQWLCLARKLLMGKDFDD